MRCSRITDDKHTVQQYTHTHTQTHENIHKHFALDEWNFFPGIAMRNRNGVLNAYKPLPEHVFV